MNQNQNSFRFGKGDVLIAFKMNGEDIPIDHGFPLRAVIPGSSCFIYNSIDDRIELSF